MEEDITESLSTYSDDDVGFIKSNSAKKSAVVLSDDDSESGSENQFVKTDEKVPSDPDDDDDQLIESNAIKYRKFSRVKRQDSSESEQEDVTLNLADDKVVNTSNFKDYICDENSSQNSTSKHDKSLDNSEPDNSSDEENADSSADKEKESSSLKEKTFNKLFNDDIYDAEGSSEEENESKKPDNLPDETHIVSPKKKKSKGGKGSSKSGGDSKKPKKELSEIDEIHKETQRMVRESRVSLPYHVPRQRTLQDFLNRRKAVPKIPLKSNPQDLSIVWKHIEERERTAESFYNSESEESDKEESVRKAATTEETSPKQTPATDSNLVIDDSSSPLYENTDLLKSNNSVSNSLDCGDACIDSSSLENPKLTGTLPSVDDDQFKNESGFHSLDNSDPEKESDNCGISLMVIDENASCRQITVDESKSEPQNDKKDNKSIDNNEEADCTKTEFTFFGVSWCDDEDTQQNCTEDKIPSDDKTDDNGKSFTSDNLTKSLIETIDSVPSVQTDEGNKLKPEEEKAFVDKSAAPISLLADTNVLDKVPKLSCGPGEEIDLDRPLGGANHLLKRFMKHVKLKTTLPKEEKTVKLSVISVESSETGEVTSLTEETLSISRQEVVPGQRLCALKQSLKKSIEVSRTQLHAKRLEQYKLYEQEFNDGEGEDSKQVDEDDEFENEIFADKDADDDDEKASDDDNNTEVNDDEEEEKLSDDEELEETENGRSKKSIKKKLDFADDEAQVSLDENEESDEEGGEGELSESYSGTEDSPTKSKKSAGDFDDYFASQESVGKKIDLKSLGLDKDSDEETDLFGLCSGKFQTQPVSLTQLEDESESYNPSTPVVGSTENLFSQEMFSQSVPRPVRPSKLLDSDDEDPETDKVGATKSTTNIKRLQFSDDEDEENRVSDNDEKDESESEEMKEDEEGSCDEEPDDGAENRQDEVIYYDSEEEIVEGRKFLEAEAELSGSEASEDEDEQGLSDFEADEADMEKINQRKLKSELERIHMQDLMAQDKREIRLLQELLLEDGELHSDGPKRQRLFRWSNQDEVNDAVAKVALSDDEEGAADEEEEDHQRRKERIEREQFLNSTRQEEEGDGLDEKVNIPVSEKKTMKQPPVPKLLPNLLTSPDPKQPFKLLTNRGSFLGRSEKILSKLAGLAASTDQQQQRVKRNMIFSVVSPPKQNDLQQPEVEKRKAEEALPRVTKRLKFNQSAVKTSRGLGIIQKLMEADQAT